MSLEENKAIIRKGIEAVNERNLALLDELMASDFFDHTLQTRGLEGAKQFYALFFKGFPDFHMAIEDIVAEGDKVWVRLKSTGTHRRILFANSFWQDDGTSPNWQENYNKIRQHKTCS